jgi:hypothetical protein
MVRFMKRKQDLLFFVALIVFALSACSAQPIQAPPTAVPTQTFQAGHGITSEERKLPQTDADVPRISLEEAQAAFESGAAIIVDVRHPNDFETSHVAGAISIPLIGIERDLTSVPLNKDQWIITYCT